MLTSGTTRHGNSGGPFPTALSDEAAPHWLDGSVSLAWTKSPGMFRLATAWAAGSSTTRRAYSLRKPAAPLCDTEIRESEERPWCQNPPFGAIAST